MMTRQNADADGVDDFVGLTQCGRVIRQAMTELHGGPGGPGGRRDRSVEVLGGRRSNRTGCGDGQRMRIADLAVVFCCNVGCCSHNTTSGTNKANKAMVEGKNGKPGERRRWKGGLLREAPAKGTNWQRGACMVDLWAEGGKEERKRMTCKNPQPCECCFDRPNF